MTYSLHGPLNILILLGWRDGPLEGVLLTETDAVCWHFKLFAERRETTVPDDRLFALWRLPASDGAVLRAEFAAGAPHIWPTTGGLGSPEARQIVKQLTSAPPTTPHLILRTADFVTAADVWTTVLEDD